MNVIEWLGKDNKLGQDIWEKKYKFNNETFDQWLDRVSGNNNDIIKLKRKSFYLVDEFYQIEVWINME